MKCNFDWKGFAKEAIGFILNIIAFLIFIAIFTGVLQFTAFGIGYMAVNWLGVDIAIQAKDAKDYYTSIGGMALIGMLLIGAAIGIFFEIKNKFTKCERKWDDT